jgi:Domain of unknown function (DUF5655)/Domain of unknown function (DUF4287)
LPNFEVRKEANVPDPDAGLESQLRNIERTYGVPIETWFAVIEASKLTKHTDVIAMLKRDHGVAHGAAHRLSLTYRARGDGQASDPIEALYSGRSPEVRRIHDALMRYITALSADIEVAPKRNYISLRRRKQFAMLQPAPARVDLGLILPDTPPGNRLEAAGSFNRLFTHRVRVTQPRVDAELGSWIQKAHASAG